MRGISPESPLLDKRSRFCYLFYKNTHNLMKYLSSPKLNKKYIAKYYNIMPWSEHAVQQKSFVYAMEEGDPTYHSYHD